MNWLDHLSRFVVVFFGGFSVYFGIQLIGVYVPSYSLIGMFTGAFVAELGCSIILLRILSWSEKPDIFDDEYEQKRTD